MYTMSMKKITLLVVLGLLVLIPLASATITVTVTAPSSVTQGSNVPITASFVAGEGDSGTFYLTCDQTVSGEVDPEGGYSVMSSTSKSYTFTPSTAQTYSNCKVSDGGTQSSSTFAVNVVAPSSLTVSGSPSSTTNSSGDTFSLSISINNPTGSTVTTSYSLTCPAGYTCSGDETSDTISISSGSTTTLQWTVTVGSSSANIGFQLGSNSNAFSSSVTVPTTTTTTVSGDGGGGGGSGGSVSGGESSLLDAVKIWVSLTPESPSSWEINKTNIAITGVDVSVKEEAKIVKVTISNLSTKPTGLQSPEGKVYQYLNITPKNIDNSQIENVKITFRVEKAWLTENGFGQDEIRLYRHSDGIWNELPISKVNEDSTYLYYEVQSPGFSYFVVAGGKGVSGEEGETVTATTESPSVTTTVTSGIPITRDTSITVVIIIVILVLVAFLFIFLGLKKKVKVDVKGEVEEDSEDKQEESEEEKRTPKGRKKK